MSYQDKEGKENKDVFVIHRAPLSTHERFTAFLIEHYLGHFPLWLSPVQVKIVTVNDSCIDFAEQVEKQLKFAGVRVELDSRAESIGKKVRDAETEKVPIIVTIGEKEVQKKALAVREQGKVNFDVLIDTFLKETKERIEKRC